MSARKLVYRLMVVAPAISLAGLGVHARVLNSDFDVLSNDDRTEAMIQAYVPVLRATEDVLDQGDRGNTADRRRVARIWVDGAAKGELNPLSPIAYEDTSTDGVKAQIFEHQGKLVGMLILAIDADLKAKRSHEAALDFALAIRTANVLKYSDFISLYNCSMQQRRTLTFVSRLLPHQDASDRAIVAAALQTVRTDERTITRMTDRSKLLFLSWRSRKGSPPLGIEDARLMSEVPAMVKSGDAVGLRAIRQRVVAANDDFIPAYCSSLRLGASAQRELEALATQSLSELTSRTKKAPH